MSFGEKVDVQVVAVAIVVERDLAWVRDGAEGSADECGCLIPPTARAGPVWSARSFSKPAVRVSWKVGVAPSI